MKVVTLGTGGAIPTPGHNLPATALQREGELFLFDCGEGAQMQLMRSGLGFGKLRAVFISHLHGDHVVGLPGLLMTLSQLSRERPLHIIGPPGIARYLQISMDCLGFDADFEVEVAETQGGRVWQGRGYWIEAAPGDHNVFTLVYVLEEEKRPGKFFVEKALSLGVPEGPLFRELQAGRDVMLSDGRVIHPQEVLGTPRRGRKVVYAVDTRPCDRVVEISQKADLLIHDGMFSDQLREEANLKGHSTVVQAAEVARRAGVEKLVLTHVSPRHRDQEDILLEEARRVFPNVVIAKDLMEFEIPVHK